MELAWRPICVARFVTLIWAPPIAAPELSRTTPEIVLEELWAKLLMQRRTGQRQNRRNMERPFRFIRIRVKPYIAPCKRYGPAIRLGLSTGESDEMNSRRTAIIHLKN